MHRIWPALLFAAPVAPLLLSQSPDLRVPPSIHPDLKQHTGAAHLDVLLASGQVRSVGPEGSARRFAGYFEQVLSRPVTYYLR